MSNLARREHIEYLMTTNEEHTSAVGRLIGSPLQLAWHIYRLLNGNLGYHMKHLAGQK